MMLLKKMYIMLRSKIFKNLATNASLNTKINEIKGEIPNVINLALLLLLLLMMKITYLMLVIQSKMLTVTQNLVQLKRKLLLIMIIINILILNN